MVFNRLNEALRVLAGWLTGWWIGWLTGWLAGGLVGWLVISILPHKEIGFYILRVD